MMIVPSGEFMSSGVSAVEADWEGRFVRPTVRANRTPTEGRQAQAGENVPRIARPGLVARRRCSG